MALPPPQLTSIVEVDWVARRQHVQLDVVRQSFHARAKPVPSGDLERTGQGFFDFALGLAYAHRDYFDSMEPLPSARQSELDTEAKASIERQRQIERSDAISFDEYLERFFASD